MAIEIEAVTDLDAVWPELCDLFLGLENYNQPFVSRELRHDWQERSRDYLTLNDDRLILLVRSGGEAVGYLNARIQRRSVLFEETFGFIDDVFVRPELRSEGVGRRLLRMAEDWCRFRGAQELRLDVFSANKPAVRFWTLSGFGLETMTMRKSLERPS